MCTHTHIWFAGGWVDVVHDHAAAAGRVLPPAQHLHAAFVLFVCLVLLLLLLLLLLLILLLVFLLLLLLLLCLTI